MRKFNILFLIVGFMGLGFSAEAQKKVTSPKATTEGTVGDTKIVIDYYQPSARDRKIIGGVVPYGQVWRTGANNATVFTTDNDITVEGKPLPKGKYALFTIPNENEWVIIFNKKHDQWGAFNYNEDDDVLRIKVRPEKAKEFIDTFNISMEGNNIILGWENTNVKFKVDQ